MLQPDEDLVLLSGVAGFVLDPSCKEGLVSAKIGIDATKPLEYLEPLEMIRVPKDADSKTAEILRRYLKAGY